MRFLITFLCIAFVGHVEAALDMPLKFGDLGGAMKLPDFSGLAGGKTTDLKGDGKGKGGFDNVLPFFVAPPAVNSSVTVYSTNAYSIDFFCAEVDDGNSGTEVVGLYVLDVKPPEKDFTFITSTQLESPVQFDSIVLCQDMLQVVPAGTGFQCILSVGGGVPPDETDVIGATTDELTIKFEDGSQVVSGDEFGAVMLTGVEGNNTMMTEFGIPSSCAAFGELYVQVPKGQGFSVGPSSSSGGKTEEDKTPTGGFPFKDFSDSFKLGDDLGLKSLPFGEGLSVFGAGGGFPSKGLKGPVSGLLSYYVNGGPGSLNSTANVISTPYLDIDFSCVTADGQSLGLEILTFKPPKEGEQTITLLKGASVSGENTVVATPFCSELPDLLSLSPGDEEIQCILEFRQTEMTNPNVTVGDIDDYHIRLSNGLQVGRNEQTAAIAVTGSEGNADFDRFFGSSKGKANEEGSTCAIFGPVIVDVPKGMPFQLNNDPPTGSGSKGSKIVEEKGEGSGSGFKLDGLADSLKLDFDLGLDGLGGLGGRKDLGKGVDGQVQRPLQFTVAPPALNATANIFSTGTVSVDLACLDDVARNEIVSIYLMTVKAGKEDVAFIVESDDGDSEVTYFGIEGCEVIQNSGSVNDLIIVPAGQTVTCYLEVFDIDATTTDILLENDDETVIQFSDGFQFSAGDDTELQVVTGRNGNSTLTETFGAPSSCLSVGYFNLLVPKGVKLSELGKESFTVTETGDLI